MSRIRTIAVYWLPVIIWMAVIFSASGDTRSAHHSSRIIGPLVHFLFPDLPEEKVERIVFGVRKCAHVAEYAVLSVLLWWALRRSARGDNRPWAWKHAVAALVIAALYAATDELHQTYVPNRQGSAWDVLIDSGGAALGLLACWMFGRCRKYW